MNKLENKEFLKQKLFALVVKVIIFSKFIYQNLSRDRNLNLILGGLKHSC